MTNDKQIQECSHPDCGRFYDENAKRWACKAWAQDACALDHGQSQQAQGAAKPVAEVLHNVIGVDLAWCDPWNKPPPGTKLYAHPPAPVAVPEGWRKALEFWDSKKHHLPIEDEHAWVQMRPMLTGLSDKDHQQAALLRSHDGRD